MGIVPRKAAREEGKKKKIGCLHCKIGSSLLRSVWNRGVTRESFQRTTCNLADGFCYSLWFNSWNPKVEATAAARGLGGMARYYLYSLSVWIKNTPLWHKRKTTRKIVLTELAKIETFFLHLFFLPPNAGVESFGEKISIYFLLSSFFIPL